MSDGKRKILVAPAWPYAAGHRHLGHVAGFGVPSDVFARYHRLRGNDVLMVSGTDEHGTPVMVAADREGKSYGEIADYYNQSFREDFRRLGLSYDLFSRTTTLNHELVVQDLFRTLYEHGAIVEREMLVSFSPLTGHTLPDRYIEGTCPICGYPEARGDQCDNCGNQLDPTDLIDPRSRIDGSVPEFRETKHLFLDLPQFAERLRAWIGSHDDWRPNVRNFLFALLDEIRQRPITRDLDWGVRIPVPGYLDNEDKRIYVWFDAVIGYLSASIEWAASSGDPDAWREWWQNPESEHYYFQGKDNVVFHTVIWPSMLLGYGEGGLYGAGRSPLVLPYNVVATEYLTYYGKQFSTSRGHSIYVRDFLDRFDADALRYYLVASSPETQDTDFTWADFVRRNNDELLANWGNLVNRTLTNAHRNFGTVPTPGPLSEQDQALLDRIAAGFDTVGSLIERGRFRAALGEAMRLSSEVNQYLSDTAPWARVKSDRDRAGTVLFVALRAVDSLKMIFTPFLPHTSQTLHELLGYDGWIAGPLEFRAVSESDGRTHEVLTGDYASWIGAWAPSELPAGQPLAEPRPLFRKLEPIEGEDEPARMIDTHAHLEPGEAGEVLSRASRAGVDRVIVVSTTIEDAREALETASGHPGVSACLGIHPHEAGGDQAGRVGELRELLASDRAVAVGETGLDYFRDYAPPEAQRRLFSAQLELAVELAKPVVIHTRAADADTLAVLDGFGGTVVLHCFSSPALLEPALEHGWYVSFAGNVTYPNASELRDAAVRVPAIRLLAETDCPYLAPQPVRGRRNEPAYVMHTLAALAEARDEDAHALGVQIDANATAAFGL